MWVLLWWDDVDLSMVVGSKSSYGGLKKSFYREEEGYGGGGGGGGKIECEEELMA